MGSTRLPGKVMRNILPLKSMLEFMIERLQHSKYKDDIIIATTTEKRDDMIAELCQKLNIEYFRGSENNVYHRYIACAEEYKLDIIVRLTSDCPLVDIGLLDIMIDNFRGKPYSNVHPRTFPDGMDIEIFTPEQLRASKVDKKTKEHVTTHLFEDEYDNHELPYSLKSLRLTVDTHEDFELIESIVYGLYDKKELIELADVLQYLGGCMFWEKNILLLENQT